MQYLPVTKITTSQSISYLQPLEQRRKRILKHHTSTADNLQLAYKSEDISKTAIKNLRNAIDNLIAISPRQKVFNPILGREQSFRLTFITLTLPAEQGERTDKEIVSEILIPFLKHARASRMFDSYIWKAEKQKNGNIHFHITTNKFLHYNHLRNTWNKYLNRLNFINEFEEKHGHRNPNSTDIHATYNIRNLENYLIKYLTKQDSNKNKITCKNWDCSKNLKRKEKCIIEDDSEMIARKKVIKQHFAENVKELEYCQVIKHTPLIHKFIFSDYVKQKFAEYQEIIRMTEEEYKELKALNLLNINIRKMRKLITAESNKQELDQAISDIRQKHLQGIKQLVTLRWKVFINGEFLTQYMKTTDTEKAINQYAKISISSIAKIESIQAIEIEELQAQTLIN